MFRIDYDFLIDHWLVIHVHKIWASMQETCLWGFANNKGADQPVHPHSLISTLVICLLESIISKLAMSEISIF